MSEHNKGKANPNAPENDSSKPMNSKREVDKSADEKIDQDFPGYPHYPAKEDIMDKRTDIHRVDMEVENMSNSKNATGVSQRFTSEDSSDDADADKPDEDDYRDIGPRTEVNKSDLKSLGTRNAEIGIPQNTDNDDLSSEKPGTDLDEEANDADVTPEERMALENISMPTRDENNLKRAALDHTDFDGEELNEDSFGEVLSSIDLDIPEDTEETTTTAMGQGDEENKYYSIGGDRHENLEEDPYSGPNRGE